MLWICPSSSIYLLSVSLYKPLALVNIVEKSFLVFIVGLSFFRIYSDGSSELIEDLSSLEFYREANLTKKLNIGYSIIKESEGQRIYVLDPITKVSGSYIIYFDEDKIISVSIENMVSFVLGNRFNSIRDQLSIKAIYASGNEDSITSYSFKNNNIVLVEEDITIIVEQEE